MDGLKVAQGDIIPEQPSMDERIARLTKAQLDCLRLVRENQSSKEIAAALGISSHTVDQRIRIALQILGVERRTQAARIVAAHLEPYQHLIHQTPYIVGSVPDVQPRDAADTQIRHVGRTEGTGAEGLETEQRSKTRFPLFLPFATRRHPTNVMSVGQRLTWIIIIATGSSMSAGMFLAGLESLSRMLGQ